MSRLAIGDVSRKAGTCGRESLRAAKTWVLDYMRFVPVGRELPLSQVKDDLSRYLRFAAREELVITRYGKAAGVLIGFGSDEAWFDDRLENDPRFLNRTASARASLRAGQGVRLEDVTGVFPKTPRRARTLQPAKTAPATSPTRHRA